MVNSVEQGSHPKKHWGIPLFFVIFFGSLPITHIRLLGWAQQFSLFDWPFLSTGSKLAEAAGKYDPIDRNEDYVAAGSDCVNMAQGAVYSGGMARNTMPHFWKRRKQQQEKSFCIVWADSRHVKHWCNWCKHRVRLLSSYWSLLSCHR